MNSFPARKSIFLRAAANFKWVIRAVGVPVSALLERTSPEQLVVGGGEKHPLPSLGVLGAPLWIEAESQFLARVPWAAVTEADPDAVPGSGASAPAACTCP